MRLLPRNKVVYIRLKILSFITYHKTHSQSILQHFLVKNGAIARFDGVFVNLIQMGL